MGIWRWVTLDWGLEGGDTKWELWRWVTLGGDVEVGITGWGCGGGYHWVGLWKRTKLGADF